MSTPLEPRDDRRAAVVRAALTAFSRYGYRKASMADIAAAAGCSRPLLYTLFASKADVFRAVAEQLLSEAALAAEAAWPPRAPVAEGLAAAILAKDLPLHRLLAATPHAGEILAEAEAQLADLHAAAAAGFAALLTGRLAAAGDHDPAATARLVTNAATGLKHAGGDEALYVGDVRRLAALVAAGLGAPAGDPDE